MTVYYVDNATGADTNAGTSWAAPFASLTRANAVAGDGDTIIVRNGSGPYYEKLPIARSGQTWQADDGHQPIIDGRYHPGLYDKTAADGGRINITNNPAGTFVVAAAGENITPALVTMTGVENSFRGFVVRNSAGRGVTIVGGRNVVGQCRIDFAWGQALMVISAAGGAVAEEVLVEDCEITRGGVNYYALADRRRFNTNPAKKLMGTPTGVAMKSVRRGIFRRLLVHHMQAESVALGTDADDCVVEFCHIYGSGHMALYANEAVRPVFRWNVVWSVPNEAREFMREDGINVPECVNINEETPRTGGYGSGQVVENCVFVGGKFTGVLPTKDTPLGGACIRNNTFVGVAGVTKAVINSNDLDLGNALSGTRQGTRNVFEGNIIYAPAGVPAVIGTGRKAFLARNNLIYQEGDAPIAAWLRDAPGTVLADPLLVNPLAAIRDEGGFFDLPVDGPNTFDVDNYKLTAGSPAIGAGPTDYPFNGQAAPEGPQLDLWGTPRGDAPDIGAHQFVAVVEPPPPPPPDPEPESPAPDWDRMLNEAAGVGAALADVGAALDAAALKLTDLLLTIDEYKQQAA